MIGSVILLNNRTMNDRINGLRQCEAMYNEYLRRSVAEAEGYRAFTVNTHSY